MTSGDEDNVNSSTKKDSPTSTRKTFSDENGDGDKAQVEPSQEDVSEKRQKPATEAIRPKQFGVLSEEEKKLIKCCEEGKIEQVRRLLRNKGLKVDCLDDSGTTPLEHACYKGNKELVDLLLASGADANSNMQTQGYTPLMFGALSGKQEVVKTLLQHGARTNTTNNIGKSAAQLAGFIGNHAVAIIISNFFTIQDLDYYTKPHGLESEGKLPPIVAPVLHRYIMQTNLHPVKLIYFLRSNAILMDNSEKVLKTMDAIVEKEVKSREMNEIMAMKIHFYSAVIRHVKKLMADDQTYDDIIKLFVRGRDTKGFTEYLETFLRQSIRSFPYHQTPLHTTMVHAIAKANLGGAGGSLSILEQSINGQHMANRDGPPCETCNDAEAKRKCSACKLVAYCDEECQKFHWPVHKKECKRLAEQHARMEAKNAQMQKERQEEEAIAVAEQEETQVQDDDHKHTNVTTQYSQQLENDENKLDHNSQHIPDNVDNTAVSMEDVRVDISDKDALLSADE